MERERLRPASQRGRAEVSNPSAETYADALDRADGYATTRTLPVSVLSPLHRSR
jgi:hypothetical protein